MDKPFKDIEEPINEKVVETPKTKTPSTVDAKPKTSHNVEDSSTEDLIKGIQELNLNLN